MAARLTLAHSKTTASGRVFRTKKAALHLSGWNGLNRLEDAGSNLVRIRSRVQMLVIEVAVVGEAVGRADKP